MDEATSSDVSSTVLTTAAPELAAHEPVTAPAPAWARPYASGGRRAAFAQISLGVIVGISALIAWLDLLTLVIAATAGPLLTDDQFTFIDQLQAALPVVSLLALIIAAIAFCVWIHRAYRNLPAIGGHDLKFNPAQAVWWWFVPVANYWQPYRVVREIWQRSGPAGTRTRLVVAWWILWIVSYVGVAIASRIPFNGWAFEVRDLLRVILEAGAAVCAILIVRRIQAWQEQKAATLAGVSGMESRRWRWYSQRLTGALALVLVMLLLAGSSAAVYAQGSYPGGLAQWFADRSSPAQLSDRQVRAAVHRALVTVIAKAWKTDIESQGSAFFLGDGDTLVTAAHVIPDQVVSITITDLSGLQKTAQLMGLDRSLDLAMLRSPGMTPLPLQTATHPVDVRSTAYIAGNPGAGGPGVVVKGLVEDTDYRAQTDERTIDHTYQILGAPVEPGMSGGPVMDAWGRVIGVVSAGSADGQQAVAIPISQFLNQTKTAVWPLASPIYVGPPAITTAASELVLPADAITNRSTTHNQNVTSYSLGSLASGDFDHGVLAVDVSTTIAEAKDRLAQEQAKMLVRVPHASVQPEAIGDGGFRITFTNSYSGYEFTGLVWTDRNAVAVWWIETIGWDESALFNGVEKVQEEILADAS
jgi:S1-C subfamily serine protease